MVGEIIHSPTSTSGKRDDGRNSWSSRSTALAVVIDLFVVAGVVALLVFMYKRKGNYFRVNSAFWNHWRLRSIAASTKKNPRPSEEDDLQRCADQPTDCNRLVHILAYLHNLPRDTDEFLTIREVSLRSLEDGQDGDGDVDSLGDLASWLEIINEFPRPPETARVRSHLDAGSLNGLGLTSDNSDVIASAQTLADPPSALRQLPTPMAESITSAQNVEAAPTTTDALTHQPSTPTTPPKAHFSSSPGAEKRSAVAVGPTTSEADTSYTEYAYL